MTTQERLAALQANDAKDSEMRQAIKNNATERRKAWVALFKSIGFTPGTIVRHRETGERVLIKELDAAKEHHYVYCLRLTKKGTPGPHSTHREYLHWRTFGDQSRYNFELYDKE